MASGGIGAVRAIGVSDGFRSHRPRGGDIRPIRDLRRSAEARLTMIVGALYIAGAVGVTIYMLWALLRPEKF
jgi:hypothetical protein